MTETIASLPTGSFLILLPEVTRSYHPDSYPLTFVMHLYSTHKDTWFSIMKCNCTPLTALSLAIGPEEIRRGEYEVQAGPQAHDNTPSSAYPVLGLQS